MHSPTDTENKGPPLSMGELQGMGLLYRAPGALAFRDMAPPRLPTLREAPSLEGLQVKMPALPAISPEALIERFDALCRAAAPRREREPGEAVAPGDDVLLDVIGFANGRLIPFSARADWWTEATPDPLFPGFFESLVGVRVGEGVAVNLVLPDDYAVESLRGVPVRFGVELKAAREVTPLGEESPELFEALGRGSTLDEVMEHIAGELVAERNAAYELDFQTRVLKEVARRTRVDVPRSLVDEEIRQRWAEGEHPVLVQLGVPPERLREALDGWLADVSTRLEVEYRLRLALGLRAIAEKARIQPEREEVEALFDSLAEGMGMDREVLGRQLRVDKALGRKFETLAVHVAVVSHVLSKATAA
ncbi:peptidylprolyl isomerase [Archangium minus]|uniref:Peptidylprolyl isomerase n=1 Tax=Archangium minus TaxID=83450 RepID=A0ABY9WNC4_9BACT|nr:peptidylprolyl isomerase [Archangium minus]